MRHRLVLKRDLTITKIDPFLKGVPFDLFFAAEWEQRSVLESKPRRWYFFHKECQTSWTIQKATFIDMQLQKANIRLSVRAASVVRFAPMDSTDTCKHDIF